MKNEKLKLKNEKLKMKNEKNTYLCSRICK
jgi:hypothetical protein